MRTGIKDSTESHRTERTQALGLNPRRKDEVRARTGTQNVEIPLEWNKGQNWAKVEVEIPLNGTKGEIPLNGTK